jgi:hypothetical protein
LQGHYHHHPLHQREEGLAPKPNVQHKYTCLRNTDGIFMFFWAVDSAVRVLKEGGMDAIKLEGGAPSRITAAKAIVEAGIAVMGHVGLTPQAISVLGGFRPQGKTVDSAVKVCCSSLLMVWLYLLLHLWCAG